MIWIEIGPVGPVPSNSFLSTISHPVTLLSVLCDQPTLHFFTSFLHIRLFASSVLVRALCGEFVGAVTLITKQRKVSVVF